MVRDYPMMRALTTASDRETAEPGPELPESGRAQSARARLAPCAAAVESGASDDGEA